MSYVITERGCDVLVGVEKSSLQAELRKLREWDDGKIPADALPAHTMDDLRWFGYIEEEPTDHQKALEYALEEARKSRRRRT